MSWKMAVIIYDFKNRIIQQDCAALLGGEFPKVLHSCLPSLPLLTRALMNISSRSNKISFPVLTDESWCSQIKGTGPESSQHTQ